VVYTNREGEDKHKTMQILSIKEDKAYLLIFCRREKILRLLTNYRKDD
jgi:hypothetical protein